MKILHLTHSHTLIDVSDEDVYRISSDISIYSFFSTYKIFWKYLRQNKYDIMHVHSNADETYNVYIYLARLCGLKIVITMHNPSIFSYAYILKRLCTRVFISHTICTSASDMSSVDTYHLAKRSRRSLIYTGVDEISKNMITKEAARSFIYRRLGVSFTKNIRIVGMIMRETKDSGAEYFIDMAYLADLYKNLTNTIFIILHTHPISEDVQTHIDHMGVDGICFVIGSVHNPEQYMHAFDIYVSPRTYLGDMYTILRAMYAQVSCIATKVGDTLELQQYVSAPLVPATSAKYLTEALMYVIDQHKQSLGKINTKTSVFPKKFTQNVEKSTTLDIYKKIFAKRKRA